MRKSVKWGAIGAGAAAILVSVAVAGMAQDKLALITQRQDFMKAQGKDMQTVGAFAKGTADQAAATAAVNDLLARNAKIIDQFPAGTSAEDFPGKTRAKPELWKDMGKVKGIIADVKTGEEKLLDLVKKGDREAAGAQATATFRTNCNGCHNEYRLPQAS